MENKLVNYLKECSDSYYNSSNPIVNDNLYDALVETLRRINPNHPYLKEVGVKVREGSKKLGRTIPMGTLSKFHSSDKVEEWISKETGQILMSPKYDGFAIELIYKDGSLVMASTRGDGYVGEDVLEAVMRIPNVPIHIEETRLMRVRGEAIVPREYHEVVKSLGYTSLRNAVPGIVRSNRKEALGYVKFIAYEFFDHRNNRVHQRITYGDLFDIERFKVYSRADITRILSAYETYKDIKDEFPYEIDGVVLKTDEIQEDDYLNPRHQIAWKFKSNRETTTLRGIEYQMGVTGYFTPIAIFDEVEFQGAKLTRASLGNITRMINEFDGVTIGSLVEVSRRGDIIPYCESLILINESGKRINPPLTCPHCNSILVYDKNEPYCPYKQCPEKLRLSITQYVKTVGVKGIGDKLISGLIEAGYLRSIIDIYQIVAKQTVLSLPRQGMSSVEKWETLQNKRLTPLEILTAYPFIDLGKKVWQKVLEKFTYEEILSLDKDTLVGAGIKGLGSSKIASIVYQVKDSHHELLWLGKHHKVL